MKQFLLLIAGLCAAAVSYSQSSDYKPQTGNFLTELNINPFNGQLNLNNAIKEIKFRYFPKAGLALRLGVSFNKQDTTSNFNNPYGINSSFNNDSRHVTSFGVNFGVEKHFKGTERLSPYIAVEAFYANKSASQTISNNQSTTTVNGAWLVYTYGTNYVTQTAEENGYSRYGVNLLTGFDFYIAHHFFIGYEFGVNFSKIDYDKVKIVVTGVGSTNNNNTNTSVSSFNFGTSLTNGVRVGYCF